MSGAVVLAGGLLSRSATRVVAKAANGFHLFRIDGYSQAKRVLPGQMISSKVFNVGGYGWRVDYYPNGRQTSAAKSSSISVYLQLTEVTTPIQAQYKFSLLDAAGSAAYELPAATGSFTGVPDVEGGGYPHHLRFSQFRHVRGPAAVAGGEEPEEAEPAGCGHEEFIGQEELERRREELIHADDRIVLRCDVGVAEIDSLWLAQDEISDADEDSFGGHVYGGHRPPPRLRQPRTDDAEYVKRCLTRQPASALGRPRPSFNGYGGYNY